MNHLVVLDGQVLALPLQVGHLHEVASGEGLADVDVVGLVVEGRRDQAHVVAGAEAHLKAGGREEGKRRGVLM